MGGEKVVKKVKGGFQYTESETGTGRDQNRDDKKGAFGVARSSVSILLVDK